MFNTRARIILVLLAFTTTLVACAKQIHTEVPSDRYQVVGSSGVQTEKVIKGYVDLEFVVNEHGVVENPVVLQSANPVFEPAAIKAVLKFEYKPRIVDGKPVAVPGVRIRITVELEGETEEAEQE